MDPERARSVKTSRARYLAKVRAGQLTPKDVIQKPPPALLGMDVYDLLIACPRLGRVRVRTIFERSKVWPHICLGELTPLERRLIIDCLPGE